MEVVVQHRRVEEEEEVPLPNSAADPVDDVADDDSDTEELLEFEAPFDQNWFISDDIFKSASPVFEESSVLYEVETSSTTVSTTTVTEEHGAIVSNGATTTTSVDQEEMGGGGVEVIELKYDSSKEVAEVELGSFRAHNPHCPNCNHRITKIILRKRNIPRFKRSPVIEKIQTTTRPRKGKFESGYNPAMVQSSMAAQHSAASQNNGIVNRSALMFMTTDDKHTRHDKYGYDDHLAKSVLYEIATMKNDKHLAPHRALNESDITVTAAIRTEKTIEKGESETDFDDGTEELEPVSATTTVSLFFNVRRIDLLMLLEILICIVYGGLIESIIRISAVASAAATDGPTPNVFAIGLAILFSGLIAFTLNNLELKNMKSNKKYKEVLGYKKGQYYFVFHTTLAILFYLVFGLVSPTTYALAFHESDNRKGKILAAAAAAFACVFLLAMAKAHLSEEKDKLLCYIKTTRYYLGLTFFVSVLAYATGLLVELVALELGLFTSVQRVTCYAPASTSY